MPRMVLVAATLVALPLTGSGARAEGSWCAYDTRGGTNCGFHSYQQCLTNLSGIGGTCGPNPNYRASSSDQRRRPRN